MLHHVEEKLSWSKVCNSTHPHPQGRFIDARSSNIWFRTRSPRRMSALEHNERVHEKRFTNHTECSGPRSPAGPSKSRSHWRQPRTELSWRNLPTQRLQQTFRGDCEHFNAHSAQGHQEDKHHQTHNPCCVRSQSPQAKLGNIKGAPRTVELVKKDGSVLV